MREKSILLPLSPPSLSTPSLPSLSLSPSASIYLSSLSALIRLLPPLPPLFFN